MFSTSGHDVHAAAGGDAKLDLTGILLAGLDQIIQGIVGGVGGHHDVLAGLDTVDGHGLERVIGKVHHTGGVVAQHSSGVCSDKGVAIGVAILILLHTGGAVGTIHVGHDHGYAQLLLQLDGQLTAHVVGIAAGGMSHVDIDGLGGPAVRSVAAGAAGPAGAASAAAGIAAATGQSQSHAGREDQGRVSFFSFISFIPFFSSAYVSCCLVPWPVLPAPPVWRP